MKSLKIVIFLSFLSTGSSLTTCPDLKVIEGCGCQQKRALDSLPEIICKDNNVHMDQVVRNLNRLSNGSILSYEQLYLEKGAKFILDDNFFGNLTFRKVLIGSPFHYSHVSYVSPKAFHGPIAKEIQWLAIRSFELGNDADLYRAVSTLPNLEYLAIEGRYLTNVPKNAFSVLSDATEQQSGLKKLKKINFTEGEYETIIFQTRLEEKAFYNLPSLEEINFSSQDISYIGDYAFACPSPISKKLVINLSMQWSRNFTEKSFSRHSLEGANRPIELNLYGNFLINYLPEDVFGLFFEAHPDNRIQLGMQMNCSCEMFWLFAQKDHYQKHFIKWIYLDNPNDNYYFIHCNDNVDLWQMDAKHFESCADYYKLGVGFNLRDEL